MFSALEKRLPRWHALMYRVYMDICCFHTVTCTRMNSQTLVILVLGRTRINLTGLHA